MYIDKRYFVPSMSQVHELSAQKKFNVFSCFAGMGGSSTGYRMAGGNILAINEFMKPARSLYHSNYPHTKIFPDDIRQLTGKQILNGIGLNKGELDVLDGSPPCAAFSLAGLRDKAWGKEKKYSGTTQRVDDLFFEFSRILKELQPKTFIAENVKGLTIGESKKLLGGKTKSIKSFLKGYKTSKEDETIINSLRACFVTFSPRK